MFEKGMLTLTHFHWISKKVVFPLLSACGCVVRTSKSGIFHLEPPSVANGSLYFNKLLKAFIVLLLLLLLLWLWLWLLLLLLWLWLWLWLLLRHMTCLLCNYHENNLWKWKRGPSRPILLRFDSFHCFFIPMIMEGRVMRLTKFGGTVFALLAPYAQHDWGICI